jgi:hypothetical protein
MTILLRLQTIALGAPRRRLATMQLSSESACRCVVLSKDILTKPTYRAPLDHEHHNHEHNIREHNHEHHFKRATHNAQHTTHDSTSNHPGSPSPEPPEPFPGYAMVSIPARTSTSILDSYRICSSQPAHLDTPPV